MPYIKAVILPFESVFRETLQGKSFNCPAEPIKRGYVASSSVVEGQDWLSLSAWILCRWRSLGMQPTVHLHDYGCYLRFQAYKSLHMTKIYRRWRLVCGWFYVKFGSNFALSGDDVLFWYPHLCLLSYIGLHIIRKYCNRKEIDLCILTDLHVFNTPEYQKMGFGMPPVGLYVCMYVRLGSVWTVRRI
jgi:hypothetical protein